MHINNVPECCLKCTHHESEPTDEDGYAPFYHYCELGIKMPVKIQCCKKQKLRSE